MANKSNNSNLHKAKKEKDDEFYTQLSDVAKELKHYRKQFKDKIVFCNCDDPTWSAFWKYFHLNFKELGLKKLISTHYDRKESTYKMEYMGGNDNDIEDGIKTPLEGNGDFRNDECIELLDESDCSAHLKMAGSTYMPSPPLIRPKPYSLQTNIDFTL